MKVKVKICGIRTIEQAEAAIAAGADFLGFNFVPSSKRVVDRQIAGEIVKRIKGKAALVGVFQNHSIEEVNNICAELGLEFAQLHGDETIEFCRQVAVPVIKAFGLTPRFDFLQESRRLEKYNVPYYLVDRENRGEGEMLSLDHAAELAETYPMFFSGALNHENVGEVVTKVRPFAVDVASRIDTHGEIDLEKIKLFVVNAKEVTL